MESGFQVLVLVEVGFQISMTFDSLSIINADSKAQNSRFLKQKISEFFTSKKISLILVDSLTWADAMQFHLYLIE